MTHQREIPSDEEVCLTLQSLGTTTGRALAEALMAEGKHNARDTQRAIQRCLDRGKIKLDSELRLELVEERALIPA